MEEEAEKLTNEIVTAIGQEPNWWAGMKVSENFEVVLALVLRHRVQRVVWKFMGLELPPVRMRSPRIVRENRDLGNNPPSCRNDDDK